MITATDILYLLIGIYGLGYLVAFILILCWEIYHSDAPFDRSSFVVALIFGFLSWYTVYLYLISIRQLKNQSTDENTDQP